MKALIVEDEIMASTRLARTLEENFPDVEVAGATDSVAATVEWLESHPAPDIIFMDVELSDGDCFEIFRQTEVRSKIIMTTAYDSYAIRAFEAGSVDYLLKPISLEALSRAVSRCRERRDSGDIAAVLRSLGGTAESRPPVISAAGLCVSATRSFRSIPATWRISIPKTRRTASWWLTEAATSWTIPWTPWSTGSTPTSSSASRGAA